MSVRSFLSCLLSLGVLGFIIMPLAEEGQGGVASLRASAARIMDTVAFELRDAWRLCTAEPPPKAAPVPLRSKISKVKWRRAKPNLRAEYYIYLHSASWCGPCREMMSYFASRYKEMKKDGRVELLMISYDKYQEQEEALLNAHDASFPVAHCSDPAVAELPGITLHHGTPTVNIMRASGVKLMDGHGLAVVHWRKYTLDFGKQKPKKRRRWW